MADVSIKYNNTEIASLSASGTKTLLTEGKYCEGNILIEYIKAAASGGSGSGKVANGTFTPTTTTKTFTITHSLGEIPEFVAVFSVGAGTSDYAINSIIGAYGFSAHLTGCYDYCRGALVKTASNTYIWSLPKSTDEDISDNYSSSSFRQNGNIYNATTTTFTANDSVSTYNWCAGVIYQWIAVVT